MPRLSAWLVCVIACVVLASPVPVWAQASPSTKLLDARDAFRRGDYPKAIPRLTALLYPKPQLARRAELAEVHLMLAVCYYETGNREEAGAELERALEQQPDLQIDPLFVSEDAVAYFRERKREFDKRAALDAEKSRLAEQNAMLRSVYEQGLVRERRPYYVNFMPFGAGQFQNGQNTKGVLFATAQAITGATSLGIFMFHVVEYDFNGTVPRDQQSGVRLMQQVQIGSAIAFYAIFAWGVIDSLIHYKHEVPVPFDPSLLHDLNLQPKTSRLRLTPELHPRGAGLTLTLDF